MKKIYLLVKVAIVIAVFTPSYLFSQETAREMEPSDLLCSSSDSIGKLKIEIFNFENGKCTKDSLQKIQWIESVNKDAIKNEVNPNTYLVIFKIKSPEK